MLHTTLLPCLAGAAFLILVLPIQPQNTARSSRAVSLSETAASLPPGLSWSDIDGDGRLDALSVTAEGRLRLVANRAEGIFEDVTQSAGLGAIDAVSLALWGDYDGDGRGDLFVGTRAGASLLLRNDAGRFVDMAAGAGLVIEEPVRAAHWLDEDGDGRLDLHVVTSQSNRVWRGLEGGFFEPVELPLEAFADVSAPVVPLPSGVPGSPDPDASGDLGPKTSPTSVAPIPNRTVTPGVGGGSQSLVGPPPTVGGVTPIVPFPSGCADSIRDQANPGSCLTASSAATLGLLYPLSSKLFIDEATGNVGINTTSPSYRLHVNGQAVFGNASSASGHLSTVSGGTRNTASGDQATVSGGAYNTADEDLATVSGGSDNIASEWYATVSGGSDNIAAGRNSTVSGGSDNTAAGRNSTVSGGDYNQASGNRATISGGSGNTASGDGASASGGDSNVASGLRSTVPGGYLNTASAIYSFAAGRRARATHDGAFVWGDSQDLDKPSSAVNEFNVYAEGGMRVFADGVATPSMVVDNAGSVGVGTATPQSALHVEGIIRSSGAAGGSVASFNPQNQNASVTFSWLSDVARIRVGGSGAGANNGFDFQRIGDQSLMRLLDNGNVGIGRTPTANRLEVEGNASKTTAGSWLANSDRRIKREVRGLDHALEWVERVRPVGFHYTEEYLAEHPGIEDIEYFNVIAQEFAEVFPDYVKRSGEGDILQVDTYPALIHALGAIQELAQRDSELAERNDELESALGAIQERNDELEDAVASLLARIEALEAD